MTREMCRPSGPRTPRLPASVNVRSEGPHPLGSTYSAHLADMRAIAELRRMLVGFGASQWHLGRVRRSARARPAGAWPARPHRREVPRSTSTRTSRRPAEPRHRGGPNDLSGPSAVSLGTSYLSFSRRATVASNSDTRSAIESATGRITFIRPTIWPAGIATTSGSSDATIR